MAILPRLCNDSNRSVGPFYWSRYLPRVRIFSLHGIHATHIHLALHDSPMGCGSDPTVSIYISSHH
jgi:hypothetical protein